MIVCSMMILKKEGYMNRLEARQLPFIMGSKTSYDAAQKFTQFAGSKRNLIWRWLAGVGVATDKDMQEALQMDGSTQRPRRLELFRDGHIVEAGTIKQDNGRMATLWAVNEESERIFYNE